MTRPGSRVLQGFVAFIFFILWTAEVARAMTPEDFCRDLFSAQAELPRPKALKTVWDMLRVSLFPGSLVSLERVDVPIAPEARVRTLPDPDGFQPVEGRHLIFSVGPEPRELKGFNRERQEQDYREFLSRLGAFSHSLRQLARSRDVSECVRKTRQISFDPDRFLSVLNEQKRFDLLERVRFSEAAERSIRRMLRKSRLKWEVTWSTDLTAVREALSDSKVQDIVIFAHGLSDGRVIDSSGDLYPLSYFNHPSAGLRSLSLYACHADHSLETYCLEKKMAGDQVETGSRVIFLSKGSTLEGKPGSVPVRSFPSFMRRMERRLMRLQHPEPQGEAPLNPGELACTLTVENSALREGTLGLELNGFLVGAWSGPKNQDQDETSFSFPCRILKEARNILTLKNLGTRDRAIPLSQKLGVRIGLPGQGVQWISLRNFFRPDGTYQGSIGYFGGF